MLAIVHRMNIRYGVFSALVRTVFSTLSGKEIQQIQKTTREEYALFIKRAAKRHPAPNFKSRIVHDVQILNNGVDDSALLWIGDRRKAKKIVYFLHGGGYVLPASPGHFEWAWTYVLAGAEAGVETAVALLQYTLAPRGTLPIPLRQAVAGYEEIRAHGFQPRDIIIGGDSAGGNLSMQFLTHALHPQPGIPEINLTEAIGGTFLVSSYLGNVVDTKSFKAYGNNDMVSGAIITTLSAEAVEPHLREAMLTKYDPWARALEAQQGFFQGFDTVVAKAYITWGGREAMGDHSRTIIETFKREVPGLELVTYEAPKEVHDGILLEHLMKKQKQGHNTKKMKAWFKSVII